MAVSKANIILWCTGIAFVILPHLNLGMLSDYKICGDSECESLMSRVQAIRDHRGKDCRFLSFRRGDTIFVYHKLTGRRNKLWAGSIDKQFGYFPKDAVQEEQVYATKDNIVETQESDFFCMDEYGYPIDSSHLDSDEEYDDQNIQNQESESTQTTPYNDDTNTESPSTPAVVSTEFPISAQEEDENKNSGDAGDAGTQEEVQEPPGTLKEQGGSEPSYWLGSSVTGWLGLAKEEEETGILVEGENKKETKEMQADASVPSSVTGWLGLGGEPIDDAQESKEEDMKTDHSFSSTMSGWLGFGGEEKTDPSTEKEREEEPADMFRSRRMSLDLEGSQLHEEEKEEMGTLGWLGNGLSNTLGFGRTDQDSEKETTREKKDREVIKEEEQPASGSWLNMGIGDILGYRKDESEVDESAEGEAEEGTTKGVLEEGVKVPIQIINTERSTNIVGAHSHESERNIAEMEVLQDDSDSMINNNTETKGELHPLESSSQDIGSSHSRNSGTDTLYENASDIERRTLSTSESTTQMENNAGQDSPNLPQEHSQSDGDSHELKETVKEIENDRENKIQPVQTERETLEFEENILNESGLKSAIGLETDIKTEEVGELKVEGNQDEVAELKEEEKQQEVVEIKDQGKQEEAKEIQREGSQREVQEIQNEEKHQEVKETKEERKQEEVKDIKDDSEQQEVNEIQEEEEQQQVKKIKVEGRQEEVEEKKEKEEQEEVKEIQEEEKQDEVKEIQEEGIQDEVKEIQEEGIQDEVKEIQEEGKQEEAEEKKGEEEQQPVKEIKHEGKQEEMKEIQEERTQEEVKEIKVEGKQEEAEEKKEEEEQQPVKEIKHEGKQEEMKEIQEEGTQEEVKEIKVEGKQEEAEVKNEEEQQQLVKEIKHEGKQEEMKEIQEKEKPQELKEIVDKEKREDFKEIKEEAKPKEEEFEEKEKQWEEEEIKEEEELDEMQDKNIEELKKDEKQQEIEVEEKKHKELEGSKEDNEREELEKMEGVKEIEKKEVEQTVQSQFKVEIENNVQFLPDTERDNESPENVEGDIRDKEEEGSLKCPNNLCPQAGQYGFVRAKDGGDSPNTLGFVRTDKDSEQETTPEKEDRELITEEEQPVSDSWLNMGIGDILGFRKDESQVDESAEENGEEDSNGESGEDFRAKSDTDQDFRTQHDLTLGPDSSFVEFNINAVQEGFGRAEDGETSLPSPESHLQTKTLTKLYKNLLVHMSDDETTILVELFGPHKLHFLDYILGSLGTVNDDPDNDESILLDIEILLLYHREALVAPSMRFGDAPQEDKEKTKALIALQKLEMLLERVRETFKSAEASCVGESCSTRIKDKDQTTEEDLSVGLDDNAPRDDWMKVDKENGRLSGDTGNEMSTEDDRKAEKGQRGEEERVKENQPGSPQPLEGIMKHILDLVHQIAEDSTTHVHAVKELLIWLIVQLSNLLCSVIITHIPQCWWLYYTR
ncbi:Melanoma inhibitory activity protein 2 [Dissostichus eleginoides]|uniref:Melanoma inhibitory activity protein 2 n=1 Tax=Dissostichus eleginoides TaxID=100907 RepID=A0AAD9C4C6_DISEL|nr:Melanoma inhibitory activity protein 2 [Dissostichus eleginoides]